MLTEIHVDYNNNKRGNCTYGSVDNCKPPISEKPLYLGQIVRTYDGEGDDCLGIIVDLYEGYTKGSTIVKIRLQWDSWITGGTGWRR